MTFLTLTCLVMLKYTIWEELNFEMSRSGFKTSLVPLKKLHSLGRRLISDLHVKEKEHCNNTVADLGFCEGGFIYKKSAKILKPCPLLHWPRPFTIKIVCSE